MVEESDVPLFLGLALWTWSAEGASWHPLSIRRHTYRVSAEGHRKVGRRTDKYQFHITVCRDSVLTFGNNLVEQREHSSMTPHIVDVHEYDVMANPSEGFVPKFVSGIEVMGKLVSRRD
jgi:hypothetical protein